MKPVVAIDWGGTWIGGAVVEAGAITAGPHRARKPADLGDQLEMVAALVGRLAEEQGARVSGVGVAVGGIVRPDGVVISSSNIGLSGVDLRSELTSRPRQEVLVVNDVQAAALAEAADAPPGSTVVLLMVGTGVGGAIVCDGHLVRGRGSAGDFGHTVISLSGPTCACGGTGCLEQLVSGRVFDDAARRLAASGRSPQLAALGRERAVHGGDLDAAARAGDPEARLVLSDGARALAGGLRAIAAASDPDRVVLGGGALQPETYFRGLVDATWEEQRPRWTEFEICSARWGDQAGLLGVGQLFGTNSAGGSKPVDR